MTVVLPSTTGLLGLWNGTNDGEQGYMDYATGETNVNRPKEYEIEAHDIRRFDPQPTLIGNGYQLVNSPTVVTEEQFTAAHRTEEGKAFIRDIYYEECKRVVEEITGGVAFISPISFRTRERKDPGQVTTEKVGTVEPTYAPRPIAHLDRDPPTAVPVLEAAVGREKAQELLSKYGRWAQVNVWRPFGDPATMWPLALMNHDRIPDWSYDSQAAHVWCLNEPRVGGSASKSYDCVMKHDDRYDYHYASSMRPEECLVFCSFDSDPKFVIPHGAFWDNNGPADAPSRRSVEVRFAVFF